MPPTATQTSRQSRLLALATLALIAAVIGAHAAWRAEPPWLASPPLELAPRWFVLSSIIFVAATVSSIVGFAFSALAGALILHYMSNAVEAVQIMMIASIGIQAYSVAGLARSIRWERCAPFVLGGLATLPIGVFLLLKLELRTYVFAVGAGLVAYGLYMLLRRPATVRSGGGRALDALIGALGGVTGPLAALPGVWVTLRCGMRGWDKLAQRAVYQPYILIMQTGGFTALCLVQPLSALDPALFAYALPGLAGAVIGLRIFRALSDAQFQRLLNLALVASGAALLFK